jgi:hypothetical protein
VGFGDFVVAAFFECPRPAFMAGGLWKTVRSSGDASLLRELDDDENGADSRAYLFGGRGRGGGGRPTLPNLRW